MARMWFLGFGTPRVIVSVIACTLPSLQAYLPVVKSGPAAVPLPPEPWHPAQVPLLACPWKIRSPKAIWSSDPPGGSGRPIAGCKPSGGTAATDADVAKGAAAATGASLLPPL